MYGRFQYILSRVFPFLFPCWGLLCLSVRGELPLSPLEFYCDSPFLGIYISGMPKEIQSFFNIISIFLYHKILSMPPIKVNLKY